MRWFIHLIVSSLTEWYIVTPVKSEPTTALAYAGWAKSCFILFSYWFGFKRETRLTALPV
jgi:hypothetical protein